MLQPASLFPIRKMADQKCAAHFKTDSHEIALIRADSQQTVGHPEARAGQRESFQV